MPNSNSKNTFSFIFFHFKKKKKNLKVEDFPKHFNNLLEYVTLILENNESCKNKN